MTGPCFVFRLQGGLPCFQRYCSNTSGNMAGPGEPLREERAPKYDQAFFFSVTCFPHCCPLLAVCQGKDADDADEPVGFGKPCQTRLDVAGSNFGSGTRS